MLESFLENSVLGFCWSDMEAFGVAARETSKNGIPNRIVDRRFTPKNENTDQEMKLLGNPYYKRSC